MRRREVIGALGAALVPGLARGEREPSASGAPVALAPLGVQLYTLRGEMRASVEATLAEVAGIGYREVEFAGYFNRTPAQLRSALGANRLTAPAAHVELGALEGEAAARTFEAARVIGHRYLVVAWTPQEWRRTLDDWRRVAERFNRVGEACRAAGLQFAYHNHDFEFRPLEGRVPFDVLCEETDPGLVQIELDLYWITHGGGDPLAFMRRWPGRIPCVHVKDRTADGRMVDVGAGAIDWRTLLGRRRQAGIRHFFVEHDEPADGFGSVRASYEFLSRLRV
jgi:sugar phosphate isomerase/epimerase